MSKPPSVTTCLHQPIEDSYDAPSSTFQCILCMARYPAGYEAVSKERESRKDQSDNPLDKQVGGDHYSKLGVYQPWPVMAKWLSPEELKGYMKGTVCAYLCREADKGGRLDIEKALHTIEIYLEVSK